MILHSLYIYIYIYRVSTNIHILCQDVASQKMFVLGHSVTGNWPHFQKKVASTFIECLYFGQQFLRVLGKIHRETKLSSIHSVVVLRSLQKWDSGALN